MMLILMDRALLGMRGDPISGFNITVLHDKIGCDCANSVSTSGSATAFVHRNEAYLFNGSVTTLTSNIMGFSVADTGMNRNTIYGALTPYHYVVRRSRGTGTLETQAFLYDRMFGSAWHSWKYPTTTTLGASHPALAIVTSPRVTGEFFMNGGNGNVYTQRLRKIGDNFDYTNSVVTFTQDDSAVDVTSLWRSKKFYFGSSVLTKQWRRILVGGTGSSATLTARYWLPDGTLTTSAVQSSTSLPFRTDNPQVNGVTGNVSFSALQLELSGTNLQVPDVQVHWRPVRFHAGGALS